MFEGHICRVFSEYTQYNKLTCFQTTSYLLYPHRLWNAEGQFGPVPHEIGWCCTIVTSGGANLLTTKRVTSFSYGVVRTKRARRSSHQRLLRCRTLCQVNRVLNFFGQIMHLYKYIEKCSSCLGCEHVMFYFSTWSSKQFVSQLHPVAIAHHVARWRVIEQHLYNSCRFISESSEESGHSYGLHITYLYFHVFVLTSKQKETKPDRMV